MRLRVGAALLATMLLPLAPARAATPGDGFLGWMSDGVLESCAGDGFFDARSCAVFTRGILDNLKIPAAERDAHCDADDRAAMVEPPAFLRRVQAMARDIQAKPADADAAMPRSQLFMLQMFWAAVQDVSQDCALALMPETLRPAYRLMRAGKIPAR